MWQGMTQWAISADEKWKKFWNPQIIQKTCLSNAYERKS